MTQWPERAYAGHLERPDLPLDALGGAGTDLAGLVTCGLGALAPSLLATLTVLTGCASTLRARPVGQILRSSHRGQSGMPSTQVSCASYSRRSANSVPR